MGHLRSASLTLALSMVLYAQDDVPLAPIGEGNAPTEPPNAPEIKEVILDGMPISYQTNSDFKGNGATYCVPASGSNNLVWLARHGYPKLINQYNNEETLQHEMIKTLAYYMATETRDKNGEGGGTPFERFRIGMDRYLQEAGYSVNKWAHTITYWNHNYQGPPDITQFCTLDSKTMLWAVIGWYNFDQSNNNYVRKEIGHQFSIVGYATDKYGSILNITIADPSFRYRYKKVTFNRLLAGKLKFKTNKTDSSEYYELKEVSHIWHDWRDEYAILESIISMNIN